MNEKINKELGYLYYTSDGEVYAKREDAEMRQGQINYNQESKKMIERRSLMNAEKIVEILKSNGWGVYYKTNPINLLGVQGNEPPIFSVNAVDENILLNAFVDKNEGENGWHSENDLK